MNRLIDLMTKLHKIDKQRIVNSQCINIIVRNSKPFQYKLAAVDILSAASVQTSVWVCVVKRVEDRVKFIV